MAQTGFNLADLLRDVLEKWNILNKILVIVTNSGANPKKAVNDYFIKQPQLRRAYAKFVREGFTKWKSLFKKTSGRITGTECLGNKTAFMVIAKKCRDNVSHFKHSVLATDKLKRMQVQMNLSQLKAKQDVSTRWNSTVIMLERLLTIKDTLAAVTTSLNNAPYFLNAEEWKIVLKY